VHVILCVAADCESPVNFVSSMLSYSDTDSDSDEQDIAPLSLKSSPITVAPSVLRRGRGHHGATDVESEAICAPILVVPPSSSFSSLIHTPDSSPGRPALYSPSQAR